LKSPKKLFKTSDLTAYNFQRLGHFEYNPTTLKLRYLLERHERVWMPPVWQEDFLTAVRERGILSVVCQAS
jgi:hypothetical protein